MTVAAKFGTEKIEIACSRGLEPGDRIAVGKDIHFYAEIGHEETVNNIFG